MIEPQQLKRLVTESLESYNPTWASPDAVDLLLMTAAVESDAGLYLWQVRGPALGIYQMEPRTYDDLVARRVYGVHPELEGRPAEDMVWDLRFATRIARVFYLQFVQPVPKSVREKAEYYKKYWNTHLGKSTVTGTIQKYDQYGFLHI